jgi:putative phosphoribosyl transferase
MKQLIHVKDAEVNMEGMLSIPPTAKGIVLFAHGSGSSRFSPRNNFVADILNEAGLATLLIDLLSKEEDEIYQTRFDINLLTERLGKVIQWLEKEPETKNLFIGLFGSSTGAAAALEAASAKGKKIKAVVSRGGRPDLAMSVLDTVSAPTLIIVGGSDYGVIELNQKAFEQLTCLKKFEVIPNATHLFEEPGCLEEVARLAKEWFYQHLTTTV